MPKTIIEPASVVIASPDRDYVNTIGHFLEMDGYDVSRCFDAQTLYRLLNEREFSALLLDLELNRKADMNMVIFAVRQQPNLRIILVFDVNQVEQALAGIRHGAYFYLPKSCQPSDVALIVAKAQRDRTTRAAMDTFEQGLLEDFVGVTPAMKRIMELIRKVAPTDSTVLIMGESGTGKELMASAIHRLSPRRDQPFIAINCAALPEQLLESELFGHVRGSFTGAEQDKPGLFEEADGGTIFLDEIGDMALVMQAKLLRVLQSGEVRRVGATASKRVDVRVLAATNKDLVDAVSKREFREDLYFRLNVIQIVIPPLRNRLDALPRLASQLLRKTNQRYGKQVERIDERAWTLLQHYSYPGNVRELESILAHAVILCEGETIGPEDLPDRVRFGEAPRLALPHYANNHDIPSIAEMEKQLIQTALERLQGNQTEAAKKLGISRSTLWRKMKEYELSSTDEAAPAEQE
ncbi:MAG: sigma-54 dependent transcriptional regulator [Candidatus Hydrogenedentales bacterium]